MFDHIAADLNRLLPPSSLTALARVRAVLRGAASPGFQAILVYRSFRWAREQGIPTQPLRYCVERVVESTTGIQLPIEANIGPGLRIHHFGGIIVHPAARIGRNCTIYQGVTVGAAHETGGAPVIGEATTLGAGCKVLGDVTLGARCQVGANAVVVKSFPDDAVLVGVPARNIRHSNIRHSDSA